MSKIIKELNASGAQGQLVAIDQIFSASTPPPRRPKTRQPLSAADRPPHFHLSSTKKCGRQPKKCSTFSHFFSSLVEQVVDENANERELNGPKVNSANDINSSVWECANFSLHRRPFLQPKTQKIKLFESSHRKLQNEAKHALIPRFLPQ